MLTKEEMHTVMPMLERRRERSREKAYIRGCCSDLRRRVGEGGVWRGVSGLASCRVGKGMPGGGSVWTTGQCCFIFCRMQ